MKITRRKVLGWAGRALTLTLAKELFAPAGALAAWNRRAFEAHRLNDAFAALGITSPTSSGEIAFDAPELSENAAVVPLSIASRIPHTDALLIFVERNAWPHVARIEFASGTLPVAAVRVRLAESSPVWAVVRADGRYYTATKNVTVTAGGCAQDGAPSRPPETEFEPERTRIRARLRGEVTELVVLIRHPMENGLRKDDVGRVVPEHFIRNLTVRLNGRTVVTAELSRGISANPVFGFRLNHARAGDAVQVRWLDSRGFERADESEVIRV